MTPEELMKQHTVKFAVYLLSNWEYCGYWKQKFKNGPIEWCNMDKWKNRSNYSNISTTNKIYDDWVSKTQS